MTFLTAAAMPARYSLSRGVLTSILSLTLLILALPALAQQAGDISGRVTDAAGSGMGGVEITATSDVLPQPRTARSASNGRYLLRLLPPGNYQLNFSFPDGSSQKREVQVSLQQTAEVDVSARKGELEEIFISGSQLFAESGKGALSNTITSETVDAIPVGQEYRDLFKLIPGVQYTEYSVRGPSAGGSGQDNVYQFDGVDVSLPLFGVLASEPSSHDIDEVSVVRGGAKAIGFNRSGGFVMNTTSKRGTNEFRGEVGYQVQTAGMTGDQKVGSSLIYDEDRSWTTLGFGGPILKDRLFFYASYYRPERTRDNTSNVYGSVGDFESVRDEFFGKLTYAPTENLLLDVSYRTSDREVENSSVGAFAADSTSIGAEATQDILIAEGSWIIDDRSSVSFKYTDFENLNADRPDRLLDLDVALGDSLNIGALDQMGLLTVPRPIAGQTAYNTFIQPYIDQYGYLSGGVPTGGGQVGAAAQINNQDFFRESFEIAFDHRMYIGDTTHDLHFGYQWSDIAEDLNRFSNGWGTITIPGGRVTQAGVPVYFQAQVDQQSLVRGSGAVPSIYSSSELQSIELNDTITRGDWVYNIGVMLSNDVLYGQGLTRESSNPITGLRQSPGSRYKMYEVDWDDMIQPRLGVSWNYSDDASAFASYARYNPAASSLARAASWDRNLRATNNVYFDQNGNFITATNVASSSGKWFVENMTPRQTDELMVGLSKAFSPELTMRGHLRYRKSSHFWEDTNNDARFAINTPANIANELYVENLSAIRGEIGGSTFVIAELDGGFTKYYEASLEANWNSGNWFLSGSYTWSHYYGNFDQDNTTTANDQAIFIGSSNIADDPGRQLWDFKKGDLSGDRRHMLKFYGYYRLPWNARIGAYFVAQSGQPWEKWDVEVYRDVLTAYGSSSTSSVIRFGEPAGSRTSDAHYQLDLNYTQNFRFFDTQNLQLRLDVFNVFDKQTGYAINSNVYSAGFGEPQSFYRPRRIQVALKYQF